MKAKFEKLRAEVDSLHIAELEERVLELTAEILGTDERLLSVEKIKVGYGSWKSKGFVNNYHFGTDLAGIIAKSLSNCVTHDEDRVFKIADFEEV